MTSWSRGERLAAVRRSSRPPARTASRAACRAPPRSRRAWASRSSRSRSAPHPPSGRTSRRARSTAAPSRTETRSADSSGIADVQRADRLRPAQPLLAGHRVEVGFSDLDGHRADRLRSVDEHGQAGRSLQLLRRASPGPVVQRTCESASRRVFGPTQCGDAVECLAGRPVRDVGDAHGCARHVRAAAADPDAPSRW